MSIHATCVDIEGKGVLLIGRPGSGKSDLALRLMDAGAFLVADDQTDLTLDDDTVYASCPQTIKGKIEVRGIGIATVEAISRSPLFLVVELIDRLQIERMPEASFFECCGKRIPQVRLCAFDASTPAKIKVLLKELPTFFA